MTDRRVMVRSGVLRGDVTEFRRDGIDAVARDTVNQSLAFHMDGRQVTVRFPNHWEENKVLKAIGREAESIAP